MNICLVQGASVMGHFASFEVPRWGPRSSAGKQGSGITGGEGVHLPLPDNHATLHRTQPPPSGAGSVSGAADS